MQEEFDALRRNRTWHLVPRPPRANIITAKWVFRHKTRADGSLERYKARWVVHGFRQRAGVDFTDTFAPVVKPGTIRAVLPLAASRAWPPRSIRAPHPSAWRRTNPPPQPAPVREPPRGAPAARPPPAREARDRPPRPVSSPPGSPAPRTRQRLPAPEAAPPPVAASPPPTAAVRGRQRPSPPPTAAVASVRVDADAPAPVAGRRRLPVPVRRLLPLPRAPPVAAAPSLQYAHTLLERAGMLNCKPAPTPVDTNVKVSALEGSLASDAAFYRSIGALQYLTLTRPDLQYAVQQV
ncbi:uncharacterized protein [Aegilops tauschii subsp. strangulata]|uniref:uncharacterized protein n=1 Tax=Aegilops tauschii subsp. strangulata TaxID=200361 RepID=UPI003CC8421A